MDYWSVDGFEIHEGKDCAGMNLLPDGSLEISACSGSYRDRYGYDAQHEAEIRIPPERTPEILAGIQAWIEQLGEKDRRDRVASDG